MDFLETTLVLISAMECALHNTIEQILRYSINFKQYFLIGNYTAILTDQPTKIQIIKCLKEFLKLCIYVNSCVAEIQFLNNYTFHFVTAFTTSSEAIHFKA